MTNELNFFGLTEKEVQIYTMLLTGRKTLDGNYHRIGLIAYEIYGDAQKSGLVKSGLGRLANKGVGLEYNGEWLVRLSGEDDV